MKIQSLFRGAVCAGALLFGAGYAQKADAATFLVNSPDDSGPGSLREAIVEANNSPGDDTIVFSEYTFFRRQIYVGSELPTIVNGSLTIDGKSPVAWYTQMSLSGSTTSRLFSVAKGAKLTLSRLTIRNGGGRATNPGSPNGGVIFNQGTVSISNCEFFDNKSLAGKTAGVVYNEGGTVIINDSLFRNNSSDVDPNTGSGNGGVLYNGGGGNVTINRSSFERNHAGVGGAIWNNTGSTLTIAQASFLNNSAEASGGVLLNNGNVTIDSSTFAGNSAEEGGAIHNGVGGASVVVRNNTFFNNRARVKGGAINNSGELSGPTSLSIESSTFNANNCRLGGAIFNGSNCSLNLNNSIVAGNYYGIDGFGDSIGPNINGTVTSGDYNLIDDKSGAVLPGKHNIIGKDPQLKTLANNGGLSLTQLPKTTSPAIDSGKSALSTDQRGLARAVDIPTIVNAAGSNGSDIGAVEVNDRPLSGPNYVVNTTDDHSDGVCGTNDCSLREAIDAANKGPVGSTINFTWNPSDTARTIDLVSPLPAITNNIIISGITQPGFPGPGVTLRNKTRFLAMMLVTGGTLRISDVTFNGSSDTAALLSNDGVVTVDRCTFLTCYGGVLSASSGYAPCSLTVRNSTFFNTTGAIGSDGSSVAELVVDSCTLVGGEYGMDIGQGKAYVGNSIIVGNTDYTYKSYFVSPGATFIDNGHNITQDSTDGLGLDPDGAKYNGGPTPTIALLPTSRAINVGATALTSDQRGTPRDSTPDIGAFEYFTTAPKVESLSPLNASDKVGNKRTFSVTVSDPNGAGDVKEVWLLLNERLSWNAGATLIYVPSAQSPTKGQLFVRSGDAFLQPLDIGVGSRTVLDSGAVAISAREVTASVEGNKITLNLPLTIRDGLVGVNRAFARVVDKAGATDPTATSSDDGYKRFGNYTVTPQFGGATNSAPTLSRLQPGAMYSTLDSAGMGPVQNFTFSASDPNGTGDIESLWFSAGKTSNWTKSATFIYTPKTRRLVLRSDDGNSFLGGGVVGTSGILENSQVRLDLSQVRVLGNSDGKTLGLVLPLQAKTGLLGQNKLWLRVQDRQGAIPSNSDAQGYVQSGTWNVGQGTTASGALSASAGGS